jgi:tricorn protease
MRRSILFTLLLASLNGCATAQPTLTATGERPGDLPAGTIPPPRYEGTDRGNVDLPRFPSISPDGRFVAFSWRGDLWKVPVDGGQATRLTRHPGDEYHSSWSGDGRRIAFDSNRSGDRNLYVMNADGTDVRMISDTDRPCALASFGVDGEGREVLTFDAVLEGDIYRSKRPYMVSLEGGDLRRVHDAFGEHPIVSPDGSKVAFTRGGSEWSRRHYRGPDNRNVWVLHRGDGRFEQVTSWEGNDGMARWMGDDTLLFLSDRQGHCVNLYRLTLGREDREAVRLTDFTELDVQHFDATPDGKRVVLAVWDTLYVLDTDGAGTAPRPLWITANEDEEDNYQLLAVDRKVSEAALSPDGKVMALVAYGEVYVRPIEEKSPTRRVTESHAREKEIAWSPDGLKIYFVSDRDGTESIHAATVALTRGEVKEEFEKATKPKKDEGTEEQAAQEPEPSEPGAAEPSGDGGGAAGDDGKEPETPEDEEKPDGEENAKEKKKKPKLPKELDPERWHDAIRFTITPVVVQESNDRNPRPSPDGRMLAYRQGRGDLAIRNLADGATRIVAQGWDMWLDYRWSPDSRYVAYQQNDMNFNSDIWIVPADGSAPAVNVTRHPDDDMNPRWSADGKILSFISERVNEEFDVWMVYLDKDLESYTPKELADYYENAAKAAKKRKPLKIEPPKEPETTVVEPAGQPTEPPPGAPPPPGTPPAPGEPPAAPGAAPTPSAAPAGERPATTPSEPAEEPKETKEPDKAEPKEPPKPLDLDDAYLRLRRVTTLNGNETGNELTPAGDRYIFVGSTDERGVFSIKWDGSELKRLTGPADVQHVSLTGEKLVLVSGNQAATIAPTETKLENVDISDKIRIDLQEQSSQKFREAARGLGEGFYHPTMKGLDWGGLTEFYHSLARQTRTADEFNHVANRFIGELNGSHLRISAPGMDFPNSQDLGRLGTIHRRVEGGFEVVRVRPQSPADTGPMALRPGDVITAVDLRPFEATETLEQSLRGKVGKETVLTIRRTLDSGESRELNILMTPIGWGAFRQRSYEDWRQENARLVAEWSGGRIGYIHIQGMSQPSLDVFERDLHAAASGKEGLIIDVRNNGGGWTADRLLSSIMVQQHAYTIPRGGPREHTDGYPQDRLFIQRYTLPINMLCNEKSFSNAEIISHAFKTLKRGRLVGQVTYGGVISTGGWSLIDGTFVRLPFRGWYVLDGTDMENHGAVPDVIVPQTPEAESREEDQQLRAATEDLLERL